MRGRLPVRGFLLSVAFVAASGVVMCVAQQYTPPPPPLTTLPPCPADKAQAKKLIKKNLCDPTNVPGQAVEKAPPASAVPQSQAFPYPGDATPATPAAGAPAADAPAAKQFPYPGETPAAPAPASGAPAANTPAAKQFPYPGETVPDAPQKGADTSAAKKYPYPGEAAQPDSPSSSSSSSSSVPDAPGSSSSSSSDSSSSSSSSSSDSSSSSSSAPDGPGGAPADGSKSGDDAKPKLADQGSHGSHSRHKTVKAQTDTERVDEDLSVAHYYLQSGNTMGAYLRAQDAVKTQPDYPVGHFVLAEAARKLKKNDEAATEYKAYLKLEPDGDEAKSAEKALAELQ